MTWLDIVIGILVIALIVCVAVKLYIRRRLGSIDGMVGVTKHDAYRSRIIGGNLIRVYKHKKRIP